MADDDWEGVEFREGKHIFPDRPRPTTYSPKMVRVATEAYVQAINPYRNDDRALKPQSAPRDFRIQAAIEAVLKSEHLHWDEEEPAPQSIFIEVTGQGVNAAAFSILSGDSINVQLVGTTERVGGEPGYEMTTVPIVIRARLS